MDEQQIYKEQNWKHGNLRMVRSPLYFKYIASIWEKLITKIKT